METVTTLNVLRTSVETLRQNGKTIALVPTMGALHEGHLALIRKAQEHADRVIVSIFVNPAQFGPNEDYAAYPRQLARDQALLQEMNVDLLWAPDVQEVYPDDFATGISVSHLSAGLCGAQRPGHFDGVATIVAKLFNQVLPDIAVFGEKDWQQLAIIRRMARDLDLSKPHASRILGLPTVREPDGLAMSSRNAYLTVPERAAAAVLPEAMKAAISAIIGGAEIAAALNVLTSTLLSAGFHTIDYAQVADAQSLVPLDALGDTPARLLVAARIGTTRLIDNMAVIKA